MRIARKTLLLIAVLGCGGDGGTPPPAGADLEIQTTGRLERGSVITLRVLRNGVAVPSESIVVNSNPGTALEAVTTTTFRLKTVGQITISARLQAGGTSAQKTLTIVKPPTIVFEGLSSANRDIYSVSLDGLDLLRLTSHAGDDRAPTAVGVTVVFVSRRHDKPDTLNAELYQVPLTGGVETRLTTTETLDEDHPDISGIAGSIVYTLENATGLPKLITRTAGFDAILASAGTASSIETTPTWSPTRDRIAYVSTKDGLGNLYVYNVAANSSAPLAVGEAPNVEPAWSPDGKFIAFVSDRTGDTEIHTLEVASGTLKRITTRAGVDAEPTWTADGRLVFVSIVESVRQLYWVDPADVSVTHPIATEGVVPHAPSGVR